MLEIDIHVWKVLTESGKDCRFLPFLLIFNWEYAVWFHVIFHRYSALRLGPYDYWRGSNCLNTIAYDFCFRNSVSIQDDNFHSCYRLLETQISISLPVQRHLIKMDSIWRLFRSSRNFQNNNCDPSSFIMESKQTYPDCICCVYLVTQCAS